MVRMMRVLWGLRILSRIDLRHLVVLWFQGKRSLHLLIRSVALTIKSSVGHFIRFDLDTIST